MTDTAQLRNLVLSLDGVHTLYPVDPAWRTVARRLRAALAPAPVDTVDTGPEYIRLSTEGTSTTASVRVGTDGTVPAAQLSRTIAETLRAALDDGLPQHSVHITVEISSIRHQSMLPDTGPTP